MRTEIVRKVEYAVTQPLKIRKRESEPYKKTTAPSIEAVISAYLRVYRQQITPTRDGLYYSP